MTRKPIRFMFGNGFGDHPTVLHGKSTWPDDGFWIQLGFSRRLIFGRNAYVETVFDMGRRQVPPWLVIRRMWRHP